MNVIVIVKCVTSLIVCMKCTMTIGYIGFWLSWLTLTEDNCIKYKLIEFN